MTVTPTPIYENSQVPSATEFVFYPDQLIAGGMPVVTENGTLTAGTLLRGAVLGQKNSFSYITAAKAGGNTGTGTIGTVTPGAAPEIGPFTVTATAPTTFSVADPEGNVLGVATVGTAFVSNEVNFTISAGGTAFVVGDGFTITTEGGVGDFVLSVKTATDGSQNPCAILLDNADASLGPVRIGIAVSGKFNTRAINYDPSWVPALLFTALRQFNIYLVPSVSAADPS